MHEPKGGPAHDHAILLEHQGAIFAVAMDQVVQMPARAQGRQQFIAQRFPSAQFRLRSSVEVRRCRQQRKPQIARVRRKEGTKVELVGRRRYEVGESGPGHEKNPGPRWRTVNVAPGTLFLNSACTGPLPRYL